MSHRVINAFSRKNRDFDDKNNYTSTFASFTVDVDTDLTAVTTFDAGDASISFTDSGTGIVYTYDNAAFTTDASGDATGVQYTAVVAGATENDTNYGGYVTAGTTNWDRVSGDWSGVTSTTFSNTSAISGGAIGNGEWKILGGDRGTIVKVVDLPLYPTYIPTDASPYTLNTLLVRATSASTPSNDIVVVSPFVAVEAEKDFYAGIASVAVNADFDFTLDVEFTSNTSGSLEEVLTHTTTPVATRVLEDKVIPLYRYFKSPVGTQFARLKITISGASSLSSGDLFGLFDPFMTSIGAGDMEDFSYSFYNSLPSFMLLDDLNINDILSSSAGNSVQGHQPLRRYVETLSTTVDEINKEVNEFRYDRAVDGTVHKSKLTDPDTAEAAYLFWLASVTGSSLLVNASGFSPWAALEEYEGAPISGDPGEWEDLETLDDWLTLQDVDPDFFDTTQSFRDQLRTGFSGLNGGRPDTIEAFVRTMLQSESSGTDVVVVRNEDMDNPFRVEVLVDPNTDPDPTGSLVADAVNNGLSAGTYGTTTGSVMQSGRGTYNFSEVVYPNTESDENAAGAVIYGQALISDYDNHARHIRMNTTSASAIMPDIGGGVADAHFNTGSAYFYGDVSSVVPGSLTTDSSSLADLSAANSYDIIAVLTDVTPPTADVYTAAGSIGIATFPLPPDPYFFRQKRLIVSGTDSSGSDNDWALYMVSGLTPSADNSARLLFVDGFNTENSTNYAYSDAIDGTIFAQHKDICIRFTKDSSNNYTFAIQNSLHDDWSDNTIGTGSFTPVSASGGAYSGVQVLGRLNNSLWSDASPLSCSVKRVMLFNSEITFPGVSDTSSADHAVVNGDPVDDYGLFTYTPTIDINLSSVAKYASSFDATTYDAGATSSLTTTVNKSSSNDLDILAMRKHQTYGSLWHFGNTYGTGNGDDLVVSGLTSGTYDWTVFKITPSTGAIDSSSTGTTSAGVTSITFSADDYGGDTILSIEVVATGDSFGTGASAGSNPVAFFQYNTIDTIDSATESSGTDDHGATWTLTRGWPTGGTYSPSQPIDKDMIHMYESSPAIANSPDLEHWSPFSVAMQIRRFWTGTEGVDTYDILKIQNSDGHGLHVYYDGPKLKADYNDGTETESVEWTESPDYGSWHRVVIRRNKTHLSLVVNGTSVDTATIALTSPFSSETTLANLSEGALSSWVPRFGLAHFGFFARYLEDNEITLLESEIS
jgi:hypothetical protein